MNNLSILSTKIVPAEILKEYNNSISIDCVPFIKLSFNTIPQKILSDSVVPNVIWIFTSANAAQSVEIIKPNIKKIACLNGKTLQTALQLYPIAQIISTAEDSISLSNKLIGLYKRSSNSIKYIHPLSNIGLKIIEDSLKIYNINYQSFNAYETTLTPQEIFESYNAILFFSPSAVISYFSLNHFVASTLYGAIGTTTAAAIKKMHPFAKIITADDPTPQNLISKVILNLQSSL